MCQAAKANVKAAQRRQKEQYDMKHCKSGKFGIGIEVLKKDFARKKRKGGGMAHRWLGPYIITKDLGKVFFSLRCVKSGKEIRKINGAHLKAYLSPIPDDRTISAAVTVASPLANDSVSSMLSFSSSPIATDPINS